MAGATVYQLSEEPITPENFMTEEDAFETPFYEQIADFMYELGDRMAAETFLADSLLMFNKEQELVSIARKPDGHIESITFREGFHTAYFASSYEKFMRLLAELSAKSTPANYVEGKLETRISVLQSAYENIYGDYVYTDGCEFVTFDNFIRYAATGTPYYLGEILGYHW